jgi:hypothetical protein
MKQLSGSSSYILLGQLSEHRLVADTTLHQTPDLQKRTEEGSPYKYDS